MNRIPVIRTVAFLLVTLPGINARAIAQAPSPPPAVIDSIIVITRDVFEPEDVEVNPVFGAMNALHVVTRPWVVRRELLFKVGEPLDSAKIDETRRNLNRLGLFRAVRVEPRVVNDKLIVYVITFDGWSTTLGLNARSTGGVFTWSVNFSEGNLAGSGNSFGLGYRKEVDRTATPLSIGIPRIGRTGLRTAGVYDRLSDGHTASVAFGAPYRSLSDARMFDLGVANARRRILQFRDGAFFQAFRQRVFRTTATAGVAPYATPRGYLRLTLSGVLRNEEYIRAQDTVLAVPDTVSGAIGLGLDWRRANFLRVTHFNAFAREEDVDLGTRISTGVWLAPAAFGNPEGGVGPFIEAQTGWKIGRNFLRLSARADGLYTSAGLDSGRTSGSMLAVSRVIPRQATVVYLAGGLQRGLPGGFEFDLGHGAGPRSFGPHAFTGNRMLWGTVEHRVFVIDELGGFMGVGFAAFADYGGAWYADEPPRRGGNIGIGLRIGATRATSSSVGRFDFSYRVGQGITGNRWVFSFGRSAPF